MLRRKLRCPCCNVIIELIITNLNSDVSRINIICECGFGVEVQ